VLQAHFARRNLPAEIIRTLPACRRVRYRLSETPPLVSILVPTRDAVELLRNCIESLRERTTYPRFEILVIDNRTSKPDALAYLDEISQYSNLRILRYDHPFNFSTINNVAAREAKGEVLCLLNNDTSIISSDWLEEMVGHLLQNRVGAVGAKLYYPDSRVQHAGVAVGPGGCADHVSLGIGHNEPGYCHRAVVAHELSAVTGACLVTWKHLYQQLGGLKEELAVAFNDVDYCLRIQEAGYRVIFTPHAELFHHESATRGRDDHLRHWQRNSREVEYIRTHWPQRMKHDPYYNPNLSYRRPDFSLSESPRVRKPWL
jgi:GT2 family glycosyltransferase